MRSQFTARARRKERLLERCEALINSATTSRHGVVELNGVYRHSPAEGGALNKDDVDSLISEVNAARGQLRRAVALLRLGRR